MDLVVTLLVEGYSQARTAAAVMRTILIVGKEGWFGLKVSVVLLSSLMKERRRAV